jgi:hypothetical protein
MKYSYLLFTGIFKTASNSFLASKHLLCAALTSCSAVDAIPVGSAKSTTSSSTQPAFLSDGCDINVPASTANLIYSFYLYLKKL